METEKEIKTEHQDALRRKLIEIRKDVKYLQKDVMVKFSRDGVYPAVSHDATISEVRTPLIMQGIDITWDVRDWRQEMLQVATKDGARVVFATSLWVRATFVDVKTGASITVNTPGYAHDNGDKGVPKAISMAVKVTLLKMFQIETGEDEESRAEMKALIPSVSVEEIRERVSKLGKSEDNFMKYLNTAWSSRYPSLDDVPKSRMEDIEAVLTRSEKARAAKKKQTPKLEKATGAKLEGSE